MWYSTVARLRYNEILLVNLDHHPILHPSWTSTLKPSSNSAMQEFQNDDTVDPLKTDRKGRRKEIGLEGPGERRKGKKYGEP